MRLSTSSSSRVRSSSAPRRLAMSSRRVVTLVALSLTCSSDLPSGVSFALRAVSAVSIALMALRSSRAVAMSSSSSVRLLLHELALAAGDVLEGVQHGILRFRSRLSGRGGCGSGQGPLKNSAVSISASTATLSSAAHGCTVLHGRICDPCGRFAKTLEKPRVGPGGAVLHRRARAREAADGRRVRRRGLPRPRRGRRVVRVPRPSRWSACPTPASARAATA